VEFPTQTIQRQQQEIQSVKNSGDYDRYRNMQIMQEFTRTNFIPQRGYPIPRRRWEAVSNTTCVTARITDDSDSMTYKGWKMPHAIVIGAQKGGSTAVMTFLGRHPYVQIPKRELHFLSFQMDADMPPHAKGIDQHYWQQKYFNWTLTFLRKGDEGNQKIKLPYVVEKTPNYVLLSDRVPQRVLCLCPWAKLILILRNPVDRAFSQYNMDSGDRRREHYGLGPMPSFDQWVLQDYEVLRALGVLQDGKGYLGTEAEKAGWSAYTKLAAIGHVGGLGRGLYSLQISQWMEAYREAGQPLNLLVMASDYLKAHPQEAFHKMCDHLDIPRMELPEEKIKKGTNTRNYTVPSMSNATRKWLEDIYRPYNDQLFELMDQNQEWKDIWNK
jgi:hypothetical protein